MNEQKRWNLEEIVHNIKAPQQLHQQPKETKQQPSEPRERQRRNRKGNVSQSNSRRKRAKTSDEINDKIDDNFGVVAAKMDDPG